MKEPKDEMRRREEKRGSRLEGGFLLSFTQQAQGECVSESEHHEHVRLGKAVMSKRRFCEQRHDGA